MLSPFGVADGAAAATAAASLGFVVADDHCPKALGSSRSRKETSYRLRNEAYQFSSRSSLFCFGRGWRICVPSRHGFPPLWRRNLSPRRKDSPDDAVTSYRVRNEGWAVGREEKL